MCYYKKIPNAFLNVREITGSFDFAQDDMLFYLKIFFTRSRKLSSWAVSLSLRSSASFW
ncbi:hypothetical protein SAMN06298224_1954 [Fibrobacter sp. UWB16]|nr:hypothetical protein SAMN06298224_1954 [Fibrobacter sp. UWB16]